MTDPRAATRSLNFTSIAACAWLAAQTAERTATRTFMLFRTSFISSPKLSNSPTQLPYPLGPPEVRHNLHDLIARLDDLRIQLKRSLRRDQIDQFVHRLNVRRFQKPLPQVAVTVLARSTGLLVARCIGPLVQVLAQLQHAVGVDELGKLNLPERLQLRRSLRAVLHLSIGCDHDAGRVLRHR